MGIGRPSKFTGELALDICERVANGESSRKIIRDINISNATLFRWLEENKIFQEQYARAKEMAMEDMADEILEIADDGTGDRKTITDPKTGRDYEVIDNEVLQRSRLRVDTRKWIMSKLVPKKYGDRVQQDLTNSDGSLSGLSLAQLKERAKSILDSDEE